MAPPAKSQAYMTSLVWEFLLFHFENLKVGERLRGFYHDHWPVNLCMGEGGGLGLTFAFLGGCLLAVSF